MRILCAQVDAIVQHDRGLGGWPKWHDESALNAVLANDPPAVTLDPAYCFPDDDAWYRSFWREPYERRIVALDKTQAERGERTA